MPRRSRSEYEDSSSSSPTSSIPVWPSSQEQPLHENLNQQIVEQAVVEALFEEGSTQSLNTVGGQPIQRLCDFLQSPQDNQFATHRCAQALRQLIQQTPTGRHSINTTLSEIEIITGSPIKLLFRNHVYRQSSATTSAPSSLNVNDANEVLQYGNVSAEEVNVLLHLLSDPAWNSRKDRTLWPKNLSLTLHRIAEANGGFIIRLGRLRDRRYDLRGSQCMVEGFPRPYYNFRTKIFKQILTVLANGDSVLLVSPPGNGKTSLLREITRGISYYANATKGRRCVVVDRQHEICGTGQFGRDLVCQMLGMETSAVVTDFRFVNGTIVLPMVRVEVVKNWKSLGEVSVSIVISVAPWLIAV